MELEQVAASIRPRNDWEATDLGVKMIRRWWRPVYAAFACTVLPVYAAVLAWLPPWGALLVLWWLRPLFDRVPRFVISRALFGATPGLSAVLRALPRLWSSDLLRQLSVARFDPMRSFHAPVTELEGLRGRDRGLRCAVLRTDTARTAFALTMLAALAELCILLAVFQLVLIMLPERVVARSVEDLWSHGMPFSTGQRVLLGSLFFLAYACAGPLYVGAGFALYLDRRTHLEGWDIELAFRRMARRLAQPTRGGRGTGAAAVLLALSLGTSGSLGAQAPSAERPEPRTAIERVLAHEDFSTERRVGRWVRKAPEPARLPGSPFGGGAVGDAVRLLVLLSVVALLIAVVAIALARTRFGRAGRNLSGATAPATTVAGLDVRPETLPDDVPGAAWQAWLAGEPAACLSLLYRGALACLVHRQQLPIASSSTEGDCVRLLRGSGQQTQVVYFTRLTVAWQSCAYAHRMPAERHAQELCTRWAEAFGGPS